MKIKAKQVFGVEGPHSFRAFTDCVRSGATDLFSYTVSGTGAAWNTLSIGTDNAVGILRAALGTVATNRCSIDSGNLAVLILGRGTAYFASQTRVITLSDVTNTYSFRAGYIDSITTETTDGVFFRYTNSVNAGKFQAVCRSNNTETSTDTGITAAANTWYDLEIEVNSAGTSALFKINGATVATIVTNIPTGSGRDTGYGVMVLRTVGTAAVNAVDVDFIDVSYDFSTSR